MSRYFVGFTGASGHAYGRALVHALVRSGHEVDLAFSPAGKKVVRHELRVERPEDPASWLDADVLANVRVFDASAVEAPAASGTALTGGVILCPCSMGTLARLAVGFSSNLVERAGDVALKEGRPLVLVPRETPLSPIHLENQLKLAQLGAILMPASPGFYHHPRSIDDLVDHVVGKILDRLRIEHSVGARWNGPSEPPPEAGIEG